MSNYAHFSGIFESISRSNEITYKGNIIACKTSLFFFFFVSLFLFDSFISIAFPSLPLICFRVKTVTHVTYGGMGGFDIFQKQEPISKRLLSNICLQIPCPQANNSSPMRKSLAIIGCTLWCQPSVLPIFCFLVKAITDILRLILKCKMSSI